LLLTVSVLPCGKLYTKIFDIPPLTIRRGVLLKWADLGCRLGGGKWIR
jgi:hypothetical protein